MTVTPQCVHLVWYSLRQFGHFLGRLFRAESGQLLGAKPSAVLAIQGTRFGFVRAGFLVFAQVDISETPVVAGQEVVRVRLNGLDDVGSWNIVNSLF